MNTTTTTTAHTPVTIETDGGTVMVLVFDYMPEASLRQLLKHATNIRSVAYDADGMRVTIAKPAEWKGN